MVLIPIHLVVAGQRDTCFASQFYLYMIIKVSLRQKGFRKPAKKDEVGAGRVCEEEGCKEGGDSDRRSWCVGVKSGG